MDPEISDNSGETLRCGIIALVGRANVGKSTLINRIVGEKVSIVSPVAQTTRNTIRAIYNGSCGQLVFLDTPGIHKATHDLGKLMNRNARVSIEGADVALLVLDASTPPRDEDTGWMHKLAKSGVRPLVVLNKADKPGKKFDDDYRRAFEEAFTRAADADGEPSHSASADCMLSISAEQGQGVDTLIGTLFDLVPEGPPLFDEEILTDFPRRLAIADVVREKLFQHLRDELPHAVAVNVTDLKENAKEWKVDADILVERQSQKYIVIGRKGTLLKNVRAAAERELSDMFDIRIRLHLWVKVERHWARNFWILKQLGHTD